MRPSPKISPQVDVQTVKNLKMSLKRRTNLKIWSSKAKNLEEFDFDIRKSLAPRKSGENNEKPKNKFEFFSEVFFFGVKKSKFANRLKRALPKFRADRSYVRGINRMRRPIPIYDNNSSSDARVIFKQILLSS